MHYKTRDEQQLVTPRDLDARWAEVDALRVTQSVLTRDAVKARRREAEGEGVEDELAVHEAALALVSVKLAYANLSYYEARDAFEHQPREVHLHSH